MSPSGEVMGDLKKGLWSHEEDEMLRCYINRYGIWNWSHMPKYAGLNRSGKSCRLRWMNYLKPNVKRGNFSKEEDKIILHYQSLLGNKWAKIASKLSGRSDNEVKNYWNAHLKKHANNYNSICEKIEQHDTNVTSVCETSVVEKIQDNHSNNCSGSIWLQTCEDDISSSSSCTTSRDHEVKFEDDYYDLCSPGTVKDLQSFWTQLGGLENLELGTSHTDLSFGQVFPYSYDEAGPYNFYNDDFHTINYNDDFHAINHFL